MLGLLVPAAWAAPAVQVGEADGKTLVRATAAKLAAWRPEADALVVVVPADSGEIEIGDLPTGITVETLKQGGLSGVLVRGFTGSWQVVQDGANWLIRPGKGLKEDSILMLRDGWRVSGDTLKPQVFTVAGKTWQVALAGRALSVAGSVAGVVKLGHAQSMLSMAPGNS